RCREGSWRLRMNVMYHEGNRRLQDKFDSRRISDRLEEKLTHSQFTEDDKTFVEHAAYFFLATADAEGRPDCSFKGGMRFRDCARDPPRPVQRTGGVSCGSVQVATFNCQSTLLLSRARHQTVKTQK